MQQLNHITIPLSGINLIEASAGTGKTYAIASLYLRLLVEQELLPEQILVVTYTEAATQELRSRIRTRIRQALEVMEGAETTDAFLEELHEKASQSGLKKVCALLERALGAFDTASIFTIHGFCLRALQDNAFESGSLYDTELVTDQTELLRDIVEDFWRMHFFREPAPLLGYTLRNRHSPETFISLLKNLHAGTGVTVIPEFSDEEILTLDKECCSAYAETSALWQRERESITKLVTTDKGLKRSHETYRADLLEPLFAEMDAFVAAGNPYDLFADFQKLTASAISEGTKLKNTPPVHPLFGSCQRLHDAVQSRFLALKAELVRFYRKSLPLRKRASNVRFFDDLLEDLYRALLSDGGGAILAGLLRARYRAALIDEFQDTDPVQYEIFRSIYAGSDLPLFLIGDPKQAIYSFRGADIFAYMRAARKVSEERRFTLTDNWRSAPLLLDAFNTLFDNERRPFLYDEILYHPLVSGNRESSESGELSESEPMQLWFMDSDDEKSGMLTVEHAGAFASKAVAGEIMRLLQDDQTLVGGKPLTAGDIAVIVRTHRQAAMVLNSLSARGIAGVMRSDRSIFATREAEEMRILLSALGDPASEAKVRAALVTDILGRSGNDIAALLDDEESWTECLRAFRHYHELWLQRGCMVMSRELMTKEGIRGRLLGYPDGERRLTNILHCFELLHGEAHDRGVGLEGLITWFSERIGAEDEHEEHQIRLETDDTAVKVVTIHVSKGLEYPVVFCPFLWGGANHKGEVVMFHNEQWQLVKDFGSSDIERHRSLAGKESLAESLRLLYVALTRAKYRCYLFSGKTRAESTPINYLFHASSEIRDSENPAIAMVGEMKAMTAGTMAEQLKMISDRSAGTIGFSRMSRADIERDAAHSQIRVPRCIETLSVRRFTGTLDATWCVSSFTSFSRHESSAEYWSTELPDRDEQRVSGISAIAADHEESIFSFPKGAQAGIFMHGIFEKLNFALPSEKEIHELVTQGLARYNYKPEWESHIIQMVHNVLSTPLFSHNGGIFTLGNLKPKSWSTELEFFFPLRFINSVRLGELLVHLSLLPGGIDLARIAEALHFKPVKGMVMGFMDMVFEEDGCYYLLDWKSNYLGNSPDDYSKTAMTQAMQSNLYPLQYLLYTVALNRYLSLRVSDYQYSKHFGGVIYVFLRGVNSEHGEALGFFRDLPPEGLIESLTDLLIEEEG
ncbi:MAG: exodeoxyribonuclease V subunit beta [Chlorobium sp.]|nr:MAG: exodeoxyribonuclease V subunit beta [Chlorobium sp.]